ncbi:hypothetical protein DFH28DRAFT_969724 [Melampsora americana]|nr:hypothetical protein DFH28DRAFT_969724 [Melampsora americana]
MKTKRTKANRRTMKIYNTVFNFREPYQVIIDADFMITVINQKIDLISRLESVLGGKVKPMITQCTISHLINLAKEGNQIAQEAVNRSRELCERRKCNHWKMKESSMECIKGILGENENKLRYFISTQSLTFRQFLRNQIIAVPLLYINRTGLILLEDEGTATELKRLEIENQKLHIPKEELNLLESSKDPTNSNHIITNNQTDLITSSSNSIRPIKSKERLEKKLQRSKSRKKEPNPLSVLKKKKKPKSKITEKVCKPKEMMMIKNQIEESSNEMKINKKKRKRIHSKKSMIRTD